MKKKGGYHGKFKKGWYPHSYNGKGFKSGGTDYGLNSKSSKSSGKGKYGEGGHSKASNYYQKKHAYFSKLKEQGGQYVLRGKGMRS